MVDYSKILSIIKQAGKIISSAHLTESLVYDKEGFSNFVTKYDKEVQNFSISKFKELIPEANYLAEEDGVQQSMEDGYCFIIDPIDGTTNFIFDYHHSCIAVGLAHQGEMIFGAVYNPYAGEMYSAIRGQGAYLNAKRIFCSQKGLQENLVSFGCARYNSDDTDRIFTYAKNLYLHSLGLRNGGSSALDICKIANGRNGLYVELRLHPWDYGAASLILEESGGKITQINGAPITLDQPCSVLAGSKLCWEEAYKIIN